MAKFERVRKLVGRGKPKRYHVVWSWKEAPAPAKVDVWLSGNVVPIKDVPKKVRAYYRDTLLRAAAAARDYGKVVHVNSSYRDPALQAKMYAENMEAGHPKPGHPLTARPGTSPHERGIGLDIPNARITPGLIEALRKHQLIDDVASEIWHVTNHAMLAKGA